MRSKVGGIATLNPYGCTAQFADGHGRRPGSGRVGEPLTAMQLTGEDLVRLPADTLGWHVADSARRTESRLEAAEGI